MGRISVQDLRVRCIVGVNPHERKVEQDLFVDLELDTDFGEAARTDHLKYTVDYTAIAALLTEWIRREQFGLIETLAERACALLCETWPQIRRCRVTIKKPAALPGAMHAAVTAERTSPAVPAVPRPLSKPAGSARPGLGKAALVTGSAKRLGREMALRLAGLGYHTWVHWLSSKAEAEETLSVLRAAGGTGSLVRGDVAKRADIEAMAAEIAAGSGRLDVLVNNVGIYRTGSLLEYPLEDFEATLQANLVGPFHLTRSLLPLFPSEGGGVVNIGYAGIESLTASVHNTAYLISKSGLYTLTKSLAQALGPRGIRVNMVSPGILDNSVELPAEPGDQVPLGRLGTCADVCDAVEWLVGEGAGYVTGINVDVAGGYMLRLRGLEGEPPA
jgi:dihydroneopterin aldolase